MTTDPIGHDHLTTQVDRAGDTEAIRLLAIGYAEGVDRQRFTDVARLFTASGTLEPPGAVRTGPDEIASALQSLTRYTGTFHHLGQHRVDLAGDDATGEVYCQAHHFTEVKGQHHDRVLFIRYQDRYTREPGGWRFASRRLKVDWIQE